MSLIIDLQVLASKTKIYMVLECVTGGDLFDRVVSRGKLSETEGRTLFQQLIDGVSYCHNKGVFHRDLKIFKGDPPIPRWLSPGAKTMIKRMLDPNPITRITIAGIKANDWFNHDYTPSSSDDENDACSFQEDVSEEEKSPDFPTVINAFELIGMSSFLDLSGLFETEKVLDRQIRFTSNRFAIDVLEKIKTTLMEMGFSVQKKHTMPLRWSVSTVFTVRGPPFCVSSSPPFAGLHLDLVYLSGYLRGRIWRVDPKLSSVLFLRSTAVKSFPAKRRGGSGSVWADGELISRRWAVGGGGGEWVAGGGLDLFKRLLHGVPLLRLVEFHLFLASPVSFPSADAPFSGVFLPWCSGLGDKPQSTWHLFGGRFRRVSFGGGCHYFCLARPLGFLGSSRFSNPVMRLVLASKTKIYMVLECVTGGDLFDRIVSKGKLSETEGRTLFQQLIDGVSYCHNKGVFHRDLKIFKGDPPIPRWLSPGAKTMIKRMLDPNPITRITIAGIKANDWFNHDYTPSSSDDENDACSFQEDVSEEEKSPDFPTVINAFELIGMSSFLDLSGLFETEKVSDRQIRFTSNRLAIDVLEKIKTTLMEMGFFVQRKHTMLCDRLSNELSISSHVQKL
uniref:non-specific serine/threonine protein kinase n=1 Tax=Brassica campestris TaxID=3711 RepID=M4DQC3_BRACM